MLNLDILSPNKLGFKLSISSYCASSTLKDMEMCFFLPVGPATNPAELSKVRSGCEIYNMMPIIGQSGIHFL